MYLSAIQYVKRMGVLKHAVDVMAIIEEEAVIDPPVNGAFMQIVGFNCNSIFSTLPTS